jgi:hypothetical protein
MHSSLGSVSEGLILLLLDFFIPVAVELPLPLPVPPPSNFLFLTETIFCTPQIQFHLHRSPPIPKLSDSKNAGTRRSCSTRNSFKAAVDLKSRPLQLSFTIKLFGLKSPLRDLSDRLGRALFSLEGEVCFNTETFARFCSDQSDYARLLAAAHTPPICFLAGIQSERKAYREFFWRSERKKSGRAPTTNQNTSTFSRVACLRIELPPLLSLLPQFLSDLSFW